MISALNSIETGHEDMVHDAQMDFYGTRLATCSSDGVIKIFLIHGESHSLQAELRDHTGPVWQVAWAHPKFGTYLASCSYDRRLIVWREVMHGSWTKDYQNDTHASSVNSVCWAPHEYGLMLACCSSDGAIMVISNCPDGSWEAKKIPNAHSIGCNAVSWAPDASTPSDFSEVNCGHLGDKKLVSGGCDNLVKIWCEHEGVWSEECRLECHVDWVRDVSWAPSVGLRPQMIASCSQDRRLIVWTNDSSSSKCWNPVELSTFSDVIWQVSWSLTGNVLAASCGDGNFSLWKLMPDGKWACIKENVESLSGTSDEATELKMSSKLNTAVKA